MPLTPGQRRLYAPGGYNYMNQEWQPDGTVVVHLTGHRPVDHRLHVYDLWGENEEVLVELVIPAGPPAWIQERLEQVSHGPP